jgi:hypothetical protein
VKAQGGSKEDDALNEGRKLERPPGLCGRLIGWPPADEAEVLAALLAACWPLASSEAKLPVGI